MKNYLPQFFTAMNHIQSLHEIVEFKEIPSMYLIPTIENILRDYGNFGDKVSEITVQHWITAIENSGYITANVIQLVEDKSLSIQITMMQITFNYLRIIVWIRR